MEALWYPAAISKFFRLLVFKRVSGYLLPVSNGEDVALGDSDLWFLLWTPCLVPTLSVGCTDSPADVGGHCFQGSVQEAGCSPVEVIRMILPLARRAGQDPPLMYTRWYWCVINPKHCGLNGSWEHSENNHFCSQNQEEAFTEEWNASELSSLHKDLFAFSSLEQMCSHSWYCKGWQKCKDIWNVYYYYYFLNPAQPRVCVCCRVQMEGWFPGCWPWAGSCTLGCANSSSAWPTWPHMAAGWAGILCVFQSYPSCTLLGYSFIRRVLLCISVHLLLPLLTALCKLVMSSLLDSELLLILDRSDQMSSVLSL